MTMRRVPLFAWSALVGSLSLLLVLPVAFGTIIYLYVDHRLGIQANFFGAEGIAAWAGWLFTAPAVIAFAIPAVGVAAELIPVTFKARQPMRGVIFAGIALLGVTALAATTHQPGNPIVFDNLSFDSSDRVLSWVREAGPFVLLVGLPLLGILVVMGLGSMTAMQGLKHGKPNVSAAFVLAFFGADMIALALVTNLLTSIDDLELGGTAVEEATTLLATYGAVLAVLGGLVFWAPKLWGRTMPTVQTVPLALLGVAGTLLAAVPAVIAGFLDAAGGVPANDADVGRLLSLDFSSSAELLATLSLIGHGLVALTVVAFGGLMLKSFTGNGDDADINPYGGHTVEWGTTSPAPADNYPAVPTVASCEPMFDMTYEGSLS